MHVVVLADTHVVPGGSRQLPSPVYDHLERADVILHAGDLVTRDLLHELTGFAPVHAVLGNNDQDLELPERLSLTLGGVEIGMVHDSGSRVGRHDRMRRWFPEARVVVYGHSHMPERTDQKGLLLLNPGSPTWKRQAQSHTLATLDLDAGGIVDVALHTVA